MKRIHVAVGVIEKQQQILLAKRPEHVHLGGLWEFPGGKVEGGESVFDALCRELNEELAIEVLTASPLIKVSHDYPDKQVLLDVWRVTAFSSEPVSAEGQPLVWADINSLHEFNLPAADKPIVNAIRLPNRIAISGHFSSHQGLIEGFDAIAEKGVDVVVFRCPWLSELDFFEALNVALQRAEEKDLRLIVNTRKNLLEKLPCQHPVLSGVHFPSTEIHHLNIQLIDHLHSIKPGFWVGVSCHHQQELHAAGFAGCDYTFLSPVFETATHPGKPALGLDWFSSMLEECAFPVYALGGMNEQYLDAVKNAGGQGVAGISAFWNYHPKENTK